MRDTQRLHKERSGQLIASMEFPEFRGDYILDKAVLDSYLCGQGVAAMNLYNFTTETSEDGERIVRVSGCVADHPDPEQRKVSIAFQVEVDVPTVRNGAYLRRGVLEQVRESLDEQAKRFQHIGDQAQR